MKTILILYICSGGLLAALSIPLILRMVKPNYIYGFRVPKTLNNPQLWYEVNAYAGVRLLIAGIATIVVAIGFYLIPGISLDVYALACVGVFAVILVVGLAQSFAYLKKLSNQNSDQ